MNILVWWSVGWAKHGPYLLGLRPADRLWFNSGISCISWWHETFGITTPKQRPFPYFICLNNPQTSKTPHHTKISPFTLTITTTEFAFGIITMPKHQRHFIITTMCLWNYNNAKTSKTLHHNYCFQSSSYCFQTNDTQSFLECPPFQPPAHALLDTLPATWLWPST